jgi:DHA2 family multidrug resistance protein-like MFS transporter
VVAVMALVAGRLADRVSLGVLCGIGLLMLSVGMAALATLGSGASAFDIGWRMALCGAGFGFFQSPNLKALMTSAPLARSGGASGIVAISRLLGQTLGASLVALCFHLSVGSGPHYALWLGCGFALVGAVASGLRLLPYGKKG